MSTNGFDHQSGFGNGADDEDFDDDELLDDVDELGDEFADLDDEDDADVPRIVVYEQLCSMLLQAISHVPVKLHHFQSMLNLNSLEREFTITCGPAVRDGSQPFTGARAELSLAWSPENSILSLYGTPGMCAPYHDPDEWCTHQGQEPDAFVELSLKYYVPEAAIKAISDDEGVDAMAQQLQAMFAEGTDESNGLDVSFEARYAQGELQLTSAIVRYTIALEDELSDFDFLDNTLDELAHEISAHLRKIDSAFSLR